MFAKARFYGSKSGFRRKGLYRLQRETLLSGIASPGDIKKLNESQLERLCSEIRQKLIATVSQTGGHLASNLGVVELTVALHRVFDSPTDQIMWDVGHQAYAHKLLTGRQERFDTLRQEGGLSGFPKSAESEHDVFLAGHSSTSLSVAAGLARAKALRQEPGYVVAVIGDGAFTNGMVYEALNNVGRYRDRLIVVLNDNEMSISRNVGTFARYLARIRSKREYFNTKDRIEHGVKSLPVVGKKLHKLVSTSKTALKEMLYKSTFFEDFGFTYLGPVDGHNLKDLTEVMLRAKSLNRPVFLHVETQKGKGYLFAEKNPSAYHGVSSFNIETGNPDFAPADSFSTAFGNLLTDFAAKDERICAITAAMKYGTGLVRFASAYPVRFFDVGIAEGHAVTFAAGLARNGMLPVLAIYSTFLQRSYDQILHDTAIERRHIVFAVDRAGLVGEDGETHQGLFDTAYLCSIPGFTVFAPSNYAELGAFLRRALYDCDGPVAVRFPRGGEPDGLSQYGAGEDYRFFSMQDADCLLVSYGKEFSQVWKVCEALQKQGKPISALKLGRLDEFPRDCLRQAATYRRVFFAEEGILHGGIAEHFLLRLTQEGFHGSYYVRAVDNSFVSQASIASAQKKLGLDVSSLLDWIESEK